MHKNFMVQCNESQGKQSAVKQNVECESTNT